MREWAGSEAVGCSISVREDHSCFQHNTFRSRVSFCMFIAMGTCAFSGLDSRRFIEIFALVDGVFFGISWSMEVHGRKSTYAGTSSGSGRFDTFAT